MEPEPERLVSIWFQLHLFLLAPVGEILVSIFGLAMLLLCSALISASEIAYFSLTASDVEELNQDSSPASQRILLLRERPRRLLATILISNNFVNIAIVILADFVLLHFISDTLFADWSQALLTRFSFMESWLGPAELAWWINFLIITVGVTFLLVLFGEVAPKVYARMNNIRLAKTMGLPLEVLMAIFSPLSATLVKLTGTLERRLSHSVGSAPGTSKEDIGEAITLTAGNDSEDGNYLPEADMLKSILKFGDVTVKQIMRARVDVVAVDTRIDYSELLDVVRECGYSRIPVYDSDFDSIVGILYVKDLLGHLHEQAEFAWQELIRTNVLYVPEAKKIDQLLKEFQRKHLHMAIVVDEYGGTSGIVTLEDILEEIIGEIKDEFDDEPEVQYQQLDPTNFLFEGKTLLNDFCRVIGIDTATFDEVRGEADSLAGLLLEIHGELPPKDTTLTYGDFIFKISAVTERRIEQIQVTIPTYLKYVKPN